MTNKEIARSFQLLGNLMELHGENKFKIRSYQSAYVNIRKLPQQLADMSAEEINAVKGIGKAIAGKIGELLNGGQMATLERYKAETPHGIQEMLQIKGFGPKKIEVIWKELGVETVGELLYAVNENRLVELKGFGAKTQEDLRQKLEYYQKSKDQFHYASLDAEAAKIEKKIKDALLGFRFERTAGLRRAENVENGLTFITDGPVEQIQAALEGLTEDWINDGKSISGKTVDGFPLKILLSDTGSFGTQQFLYTLPEQIIIKADEIPQTADEKEVFKALNWAYLEPELRSSDWAIQLAKEHQVPDLLQLSDIKGVVHNHSTYSDGMQSIQEMAAYSQELGYEYLVMTDHSKSAFYANGLKEDRVLQQFAEIDQLNQSLENFKILKGIESDILSDGALDYEDDLLAQFDVVIASVHSNLRMDEHKATQRLLKAIENPYTHILGHPTGRLLLSRKGYPIDHQLIIDACAENKVSIELNANPYRLDLDWTWIPYAMEKGVLISINPDAHSTSGIHHIKYGVISARKGGLTAENCLNTRDLEGFLKALKK